MTSPTDPQRPTRVRWTIVALLTGLSLTSYLLRMNISVASKFSSSSLYSTVGIKAADGISQFGHFLSNPKDSSTAGWLA